MGRKRTACSRCANIKTACNKELPCSRCKRLGLHCEFQNGLNPDPQELKGKGRAEHKRSIFGCVNCLTRRKKCDEKLPVCGDCERLGLPCVSRNQHRSQFAASPRSSVSETSSPGFLSKIMNTDGPVEINYDVAFREAESRLSSDTTAPYHDWITLIDDDSSWEITRKDHLDDSSAMVVLPEARVSDDGPSLGTKLPTTALNDITGVTVNALTEWSVGEKHLLNHFQQVVARLLVVVDDDENPFLVDVIPMAFKFFPVRHAIVAFSACHLLKVYPSFERNVLKHRSLALQGLKAEINKNDRTIDCALATTLLLCLLEICEGKSRKWVLHLHGAKALISSFTSQSVEYPLSFLFELYDFLSSITTITCNQSPFVPFGTPYPLVQLQTRPRRQGMHPLLGFAGELYTSLNAINRLAARRSSLQGTSSEKAAFLAAAREIELSLQGWTAIDQPDSNNRHYREVTAGASAVQWAALMRLFQVVYGMDVSITRVQTAVDNILSAISLIRPGSQVEARILFPLFMAGIGSTSKAYRLTVEYRLNTMETTLGFDNIRGAHKLLDCVWQKMNEGEKTIDWELLIQTEYAGVVLL